MMSKEKPTIDEILDAVDKFNSGDENAFEGMTITLDEDS